MSLIEHFPVNYEPRDTQKEILKGIHDAFEAGHKYIVVQAPTGCGKSHLAATLANYSKDAPGIWKQHIDNNTFFRKDNGEYMYADELLQNANGTYVLTVTKQLQKQYEEIFHDSSLLKGKANYTCNVDPAFNVNVAPCVLLPKMMDECILVSRCAYFNALNGLLANKFRITNYSKYLTLPDHAKCCDILICDEASEIEDTIINFYTLTINYKKLFHYGITKIDRLLDDSPRTTKLWLTDLLLECTEQFEKVSRSIKNEIHSANHIRGEIDRLSGIKNLLEKIQVTLENWSNGQYVITRDKDSCSFVPLHAKNLTDILFENVNHVVFLSGTIYDCETFTRNLGIKKYRYVEHPGTFDPKRSPVYAPCKVSLNHSTLEQGLKVIKTQIEDICNMFTDSKGVIHTHTNKITGWLQQNLKNPRLLYRSGHSTNEHILHDHISTTEPTVLVSPSMVFGVDLPDDLCRFQIIVKLPYPSLGDKRIKTLAKEDPDWYQSKMYTKIIQMCGRGSRNINDTCATFILDGNFIRVTKQNWNKIPEWFRNRLM